jgi:nicotinamidase-related amidase
MPAPHPRLHRDRTVILVVDVQDRLTPAMPPETLARLVKYARALIHCGKTLGLPVLATEQYPKGLGPTAAGIRALLPAEPLVKMNFSCGADPAFRKALEATGRKQVIVVGIETHVCVFQTVRDLLAAGYETFVCADAVTSRAEEHRRIALEQMRDMGAVVTSAETAIFDLLHTAGTAEFKRVAPLVK